MKWAVVLVGAVVVLAGCGAAYVSGVGPSPGNSEDIDSFPTETPGASGGSGSGDGGSAWGGSSGDDGGSGDGSTGDGSATDGDTDAAASGSPFTLTVDRIENCGNTCRDVTTTLTNEQSTAAENVTVYTRIFAGNGTDGDVVWQGVEAVGRLDAGESVTATERIELSYTDGLTVRQHDGWVTIQTTIQSDGETVTVTKRRQVA